MHWLFLSDCFCPTLKSHTMMKSFKESLKRKTDGISSFVVCYPSRLVFLFVWHAQYEVSLTSQLPFFVGGFKIFVIFCVGCLARVCRQGSAMVDGFLLLTSCCNVSINRRLYAPQQCIISFGVLEVYSAFDLIDVRRKCIVGDDLFFPWQPLISGGRITQKLRHITAYHAIINVGITINSIGINTNYLQITINSLWITIDSHLCCKSFLVPVLVLLCLLVPLPPMSIFLQWIWRHMVFGMAAGLFDSAIFAAGDGLVAGMRWIFVAQFDDFTGSCWRPQNKIPTSSCWETFSPENNSFHSSFFITFNKSMVS